MKKQIVIPVVLLAAAGTAVFARALRGSGRHPENRIVISGNIELTEVNIAFKASGKLVERAVNEGDTVTKGQIVARLDRDQLTAERAREAAGVTASEAQLAQAATALEWQRATLVADIEQHRAELAAAEAKLNELRTGSRPEERGDARAAVQSAQADAERAKKDFERAQVLHRNDDISTQQFDQFRGRTDIAQAALKSAQERLAMVEAGPRSEQIDAQVAQVGKARAALKMAEANALESKRREQELATRRAEIAQGQAGVALIDTQVNETVAASPIDGVVLVKGADVGEVLAPGATVVTVGDIDHPWLRGYVNETDLGKVKLGSRVEVTTDSYPGKIYHGRVTFLSSQAEFTPKQIQTQQERVKLVYRVKIEMENPARELKSNMPADAQIVLEP